MSFFTILRSIEDLLYEVMTWLIFYPRTMWQVIRHPGRMIDYSDHEQSDKPEEQYIDTLSPPMFLMLTILIAHGLQITFHAEDQERRGGVAALLGGSQENLLILQVVLFSIYPLMFALGLLKRSDQPLDRKTLRAPFFSQCYLGALFALLLTIASIMLRAKMIEIQVAGLVLSLATGLWYMAIQSVWLSEHLKITRVRAAGLSFRTLVKATLINAAFSSLFFV
ncbi:hypothetical protein [Sphingomonas cavernae]|uniref:Permease n=1 Tax=Sphingomonas cavernae TaxID=2320861 RepID=A0A418W6K8_9SPHN|nr:hypothetical protein [Sphingomonas cavernae]RJF85652.1 hypothetical protein D3876_17270 [Sphingomonas cavernae]